jgi:hypothetical protein
MKDNNSMDNEARLSVTKTHRLIIAEWMTLLSVFIACFLFLLYKIEKQSERTDRLYEMFIDLLKDKR